jgi:hypothetical protein
MSETIRMGLQTVFGIAMALFGRVSPRLASAINVGMVLTSPEVWPSVWGIYQSNQNTPRAAATRNVANDHDPFAYLEQHGQASQEWADHQGRTREEAARQNPTQTKIEPGTDGSEVTADFGKPAVEEETPEHTTPANRKSKRGRPDGE